MIRVRIYKQSRTQHKDQRWCWAIDQTRARGNHTIKRGRATTWKQACFDAANAHLITSTLITTRIASRKHHRDLPPAYKTIQDIRKLETVNDFLQHKGDRQ